jgi:glycosyltransferase involved in cell wall biosynthesis
MPDPLVSVIIPTFNRMDFVCEAIESVMEGTFREFELIVVDDGSTDGTASAVDRLGEGIRYHYQPNRGVSAARNQGVSISRGKYIAFLDSDDQWMKKKLEAQIDYMTANPDVRISHTEEVWIRNGVRVNQGKRHRKFEGEIFERCLPLCIISPSSILMERKVFDELGGFDEELPVCEDYDLWLRLTLRYHVGFIEEPLVIKRGGHPDQLSRRYWGMDRFRILSMAGLIIKGEVNGEKKVSVLEEIDRKCNVLAGGARKRGREEEAKYLESLSERLDDPDCGDGVMSWLKKHITNDPAKI